MWQLELGDRGVLAPGRWRWLRAIAWAVLLFGLVFGGFVASIELADWVHLSPPWAHMFAGALPIITTLLYAWLVRKGEQRRASELAIGALLGLFFMAAYFGLLWSLGLYRIEPGHKIKAGPARYARQPNPAIISDAVDRAGNPNKMHQGT